MRKGSAILSTVLIISMLLTTVSVDVLAEEPVEVSEEEIAEEPEEASEEEIAEDAEEGSEEEVEEETEDPGDDDWEQIEMPIIDEEDPMKFDRPNQESAVEDLNSISTFSLKSTGKIKAYGIDVSYYDGVIDWDKVAAAVVDFAIIRIGYRGYGTGKLVTDTQAINNLKGAQAAGVKIGAYFYSTALNTTEAEEEAKYTCDILKDYNVSYPVAYDCEGYYNSDSRDYGLSVSKRSKNAIAFLDYVQCHGYTGMMYASKSSFDNNTNWDTTTLSDRYHIWVAQYLYKNSSKKTFYTTYADAIADSKSTSYTGAYRFWQFTSSGKVNGINHVVDLDFEYNTTGSVSTTVTNVNAVQNLSSTSVSKSSISLSWKKLSGMDGYQVRRKVSGGSYETVTTTSKTTYKDSSLKAGTVYYYKVRGYTTDENGKKVYSDYSSVLKVATKPTAPSSFKGSATAFDTIKLTWGKVSGASGYQIQRYNSSKGKYSTVKTVTSGSTKSYSNKSLNSSTKYKYRIRAYITVSGNKTYSAWSDVISVKTKGSVKGTVNANNVNLRSGAGTSYKSYKTVNKGKTLTITGSSGSWYRTSTTVSGKKKTCYIKKSYVKLNSSSTSKPGKTTLKKSKATYSTIKLTWKKVSGASGYQIQRYSTSKKKYVTVKTIKEGSTTSYTNKHLNSATTYKYRIRAYKTSNGKKTYGSWSGTLKAKTGKSVSGKTTGTNVAIRKGADTSYDKLTTIKKKGTKLTITGERSGWYRVSVTVNGKKKTGYISKKYAKRT